MVNFQNTVFSKPTISSISSTWLTTQKPTQSSVNSTVPLEKTTISTSIPTKSTSISDVQSISTTEQNSLTPEENTISSEASQHDSNDILNENIDKPKRYTLSAAKTSGIEIIHRLRKDELSLSKITSFFGRGGESPPVTGSIFNFPKCQLIFPLCYSTFILLYLQHFICFHKNLQFFHVFRLRVINDWEARNTNSWR